MSPTYRIGSEQEYTSSYCYEMAEAQDLIRWSILFPGGEASYSAPRPAERGKPNYTAISHRDDDDSDKNCLVYEPRGL